MIPIIDFHCDLLYYLAQNKKRVAENDESRCSLQQLSKGHVLLQTLAIFTMTKKQSVDLAKKEIEIFYYLPNLYPRSIEHLKAFEISKSNNKIYIVAGIENASGLCEEDEDLEQTFLRLDEYSKTIGPILYISLTWNDENRFGGGNNSKTGLKRDGALLLEYLSGKKIAIDLSHTSDRLAYDILEYLDAKNLDILPIASHSNFRFIANHPRNLPDEIAKEIIRRKGLIGLNFVKDFIGKTFPDDFIKQVSHAISIGGLDTLCFGADFFYEGDFDKKLPTSFYSSFDNSASYPKLIDYLSRVFTKQEIEKIAHINFRNFLSRINR
ncbi:MAG: membrane dipeptidase [Chlamydiales bacterium]